MSKPFDDPVGRKIFDAFGPSHNEYRSLGGIQRSSGLPQVQVESYIAAHADFFSQSSISPSGLKLYRPNPLLPFGT